MATSERRLNTKDDEQTATRSAPALTTASKPAPAYKSPVDRQDVDHTRPYFLLALAVFFFALSSVGTVLQVGIILALFGAKVGIVTSALVGIGVAVLISAGEVYSSESPWYLCFLIPDVALTVWWLAPACVTFAANVGIPGWATFAGGACLGIISAYLPERVIFGQRRRAKLRSVRL
jgi:putative flippase GtrA